MSLEQISLQYSEAQETLQSSLSGRQQLETQLQENKIVLEEFEKLDDDAKVFKQTGPVLLPQDLFEAKTNVEKRIEFITKEIERVEGNITESQAKMETFRQKIIELRTQQQQQQQQQPQVQQ